MGLESNDSAQAGSYFEERMDLAMGTESAHLGRSFAEVERGVVVVGLMGLQWVC